ncbi:MAG: restriction endonuclease [Alphaproteobacteria bacterium]|nr:restriction endonuclease [Alphaproteobacteria bacterium]
MTDASDEEGDAELDGSNDDIAARPNEAGDPQSIVDAKVPSDIRKRFEVFSYRNAAVILSESHSGLYRELLDCLRRLNITTQMMRTAGGNESDIPKLFNAELRNQGWYETKIEGDLLVRLLWKEKVGENKSGKAIYKQQTTKITRPNYIDGHKIDYVKSRVAFDLEWNSKDQTFDRDLYAFNAFSQCGAIDVGVLVTRGTSLNPLLRKLGPALTKTGEIEHKRSGAVRMSHEKYGASTTWMGKLLYRLNAGRNGSCPVLALGITPNCISDWSQEDA